MIYGYARVSTVGQVNGTSLDTQEEELRRNGAEEIYTEAYTGTKKDRPELNQLMEKLKSGDVLMVTKMDRIARSARDGIDLINELVDRGVIVHILNMGRIENTPTGKLMRTMLLAFAEFERDLIVQRTQDGKAKARLRPDWREGRPPEIVYDPDEFYALTEKVDKGEMTVTEACEILGFKRAKWYRIRNGKEKVAEKRP